MLERNFFQRDTTDVARDLIGCHLVVNGEVHQITETEAYLGAADTASHARFGKTQRSRVMYGPPGVMYVYLIYGIHHMLNIVTESAGEPGAVLIRGVAGHPGPGKLTGALEITKAAHNDRPLNRESGVWIEERPADFTSDEIVATSRVGIEYADDEWRDKLLRFVWTPPT